MFKYLLCTGSYSWMVRYVHCGLTLCVVGSLLLYNSFLYKTILNPHTMGLGIMFLISHLIGVIVYLTLSYMNPGFIPLTNISSNYSSDESDSEEVILKRNSKNKSISMESKYRFCSKCKIKQLLRSKHCVDCNRCVQRYDHHCPWIDNCIGELNHSLFVAFMAFELLLITWTCYWSWLSLNSFHLNSWSTWFKLNWQYLINIIVCLCGGIPLFALVIFHLYLAFINSTTWEQASRDKISYLRRLNEDVNPFHQGYLVNFCQFCCRYKHPGRWDIVYSMFSDDNKNMTRSEDEDDKEDCGNNTSSSRINGNDYKISLPLLSTGSDTSTTNNTSSNYKAIFKQDV